MYVPKKQLQVLHTCVRYDPLKGVRHDYGHYDQYHSTQMHNIYTQTHTRTTHAHIHILDIRSGASDEELVSVKAMYKQITQMPLQSQ